MFCMHLNQLWQNAVIFEKIHYINYVLIRNKKSNLIVSENMSYAMSNMYHIFNAIAGTENNWYMMYADNESKWHMMYADTESKWHMMCADTDSNWYMMYAGTDIWVHSWTILTVLKSRCL